MCQQAQNLLGTLSQIILVAVGGILGFLSSWVVSKRERKSARADQRREKIYGPLQDELPNINSALSNNAEVLQFISEYPRIKLEHIRYMIPKDLRKKVVELYEQTLPSYGEEKKVLGQKYNMMMRTQLTYGLKPVGGGPSAIVTSTSSPYVASMANLSYWLVEGQIPSKMEKEIKIAFQVVKEDSRKFVYATWQEFFEAWRKRQEHDEDFKKFVETREKAVRLIREISTEITNDLESEN